MSFVSIAFLLLYPLVLGLRLLVGRDARETPYLAGLLASSLIFYGWHEPAYLLLIGASTGVDYLAARSMDSVASQDDRLRRRILTLALAVDLGLLAAFKYAGFAGRLVAALLERLGVEAGPGIAQFSTLEILLPIGISFYTFQSMSYSIDVYRRRIPAESSLLRVALYVSFFPQLVAGPIVRAGDFLGQLERRRRLRSGAVFSGVHLIVRGLFLKLVVADNLAPLVDQSWGRVASGEAEPGLALATLVFFSCQLLCDFAGYCDIARGLAYPLGFRLPVNFDAPFLATTFSGFWRRWHITLSSWMRDYLYVPLGGNRGTATRTGLNLFAVLVMSGLWHGAAVTFVVWGALHGLAIVLERVLGVAQRGRALRVLWFFIVQGGWIASMAVFRARDLGEAGTIAASALAALLHPSTLLELWSGPAAADVVTGCLLTLPVWAMHARAALNERRPETVPGALGRAVQTGVMLALVLTFYTRAQSFLYFQF